LKGWGASRFPGARSKECIIAGEPTGDQGLGCLPQNRRISSSLFGQFNRVSASCKAASNCDFPFLSDFAMKALFAAETKMRAQT
jgi:hypothetical protein